jgi:hypothetical protein
MAFAFEPNACIGRHRVNIGGTVLATDSGCGSPIRALCVSMAK